MKEKEIASALHPLELKVFDAIAQRQTFEDGELVGLADISESQVRTVVEWQLAKGCMEVVSTQEKKWVELTEIGQGYLKGTPEELLIAAVQNQESLSVQELMNTPGVDSRDAGTALGVLKKANVLVSNQPGFVELDPDADIDSFKKFGRLIQQVGQAGRLQMQKLEPEDIRQVEQASRKRAKGKGVFRVGADVTRTLKWTELGIKVRKAAQQAGRSADEVNLLTPEMLVDGSWQGKTFRRYSLGIPPPRRFAGRRHPYREFLDFVRQKLVGLGFEEMRGQLVETEFWNMDALFMPQFHVARDIHDAYFIKEPTLGPNAEEPYLSRVAQAHTCGGETGSRGWAYPFDQKRSRRLLLRSQGTVLSARWLKKAKIPGKYFGIARCFRPDQVDATHAPDFFQCEGIVLGSQINFVTLLGLLRLFAEQVAKAKEIKFTPAYFPFTEPSVEIHIKHPEIGWMELGGAGIFRPEVTWPQGVEVPVIAWGLGLDRMAMMALGIDDIRDLFSRDLNKIRGTTIRIKD